MAIFLAILELYKLGHVAIEQSEAFGPMDVARARDGVPVGIAMLGADFDAPEVDAEAGQAAEDAQDAQDGETDGEEPADRDGPADPGDELAVTTTDRAEDS